MANVSGPVLKRGQAARGHHHHHQQSSEGTGDRRGRRGSAVTFDEITSIYPLPGSEVSDLQQEVGALRGEPEEEEEDYGQSSSERCYSCNTLLEKKRVRQFFRVCGVINLLSLAFSAPLQTCSEGNNQGDNCDGVFIQFVTIAVIDVLVSLVYTVKFIMQLHYTIFIIFQATRKKTPSIHDSENDHHRYPRSYRNNMVRLFSSLLVMLSLWYSVSIGVYRSTRRADRPLDWYFYLPLILRSVVTISTMRLFVHLKIPSTAVNGLLKNIRNRWKQLFFVTVFYIFFVYIFALIGVQWIGGLNERCFYQLENGDYVPSIPTTHCNTIAANSTNVHRCYGDVEMTCMEDNGTNFNYRNTVYLGQYRYILDALFAVYEASSWELWSFMSYNAVTGSSRDLLTPIVFYITMIFFLVVFVQQSIFLVVIIESFADLRSDEAVESSNKQQDKPTIVLYEQRGGSNEISFKHIKTQESLTAFKQKLNKYYFKYIEKVFIVLVLVDAVVVASKHTGMSETWADVIMYWEFAVSILFVLEVVGLFLFHLLAMPMQILLFLKNYYFLYLLVVAIGSLIGSVPLGHESEMNKLLNSPLMAGNILAVFQASRLPRTLRLVPQMRRFFSDIIGDGFRLLIVILIVFVFLIWFAVVSMQIFGYLRPEEGCERVGSDMFRDFLRSLRSMFQLLMQEGWTQLFSELMCLRDWVFIFINLYFIILHLIASLFLLNFFVAVILDNLDYDEEIKIKKLEEAEKNVQKVQRVPRHLQIFRLGGPKKIPVPKLSSAAAPDLTEADVRNFYNIGETTDFPTGFIPNQPPLNPLDTTQHRRASELSNLDLLTNDSTVGSNLLLAQQGQYWGVQRILGFIKVYRERSQENEGTRPSLTNHATLGGGDLLRAKGKNDSSSPLQSQYEEYREKYRLFDMALFCMPPDHKLRKFCRTILTSQMKEPASLKETERQGIIKTVFQTTLYLIRSLVSLLPYFTWFMFFVTIACLSAQMREIDVAEETSPPKFITYIWWMDLVFVIFTLGELLLKILSNGLFFNPHAAIQSLWDVLDWLIVMATLVVMIVYVSSCSREAEFMITFRALPTCMIFLLSLRALRPLRLISLVPSMRHVIYDLLLGWRKFLLGALLLVLFIFMFASLGVQLFAGTDSPEGFCNDPTFFKRENCTGEFNINIQTSLQEALPLNTINDTSILVPRVWYESRRDFKFDNTYNAFLTLFEVLTLEGWLDVRDLFGGGLDSVFSWYMSFYIHTFVFLGVNFGLQLFVGIVVNNFNEHKPDHSALLTVSQKRWTDLLQRISLSRPIKKPPPPLNNKFRIFLYRIFVSSHYKNFSTLFTLLNSCCFWAPWVRDTDASEVLMSASVVFAALFFVEVLLKLIAFGMKYFQSSRNIFDLTLSLLGICYAIVAIVYLSINTNLNIDMIADAALLFAVVKLFTILVRYSILQNLLITVYKTFYKSVALLLVLLAILLLYTFLGTILFSSVRTGEAMDHALVNFTRILTSLNLLIRVVTGEDWHTVFRDTMVSEPYCSSEEGTCGVAYISIFFFITFYVFVSFILLNVIIAVLLENFSIFYNEDDTEVNHAVVRDFKQHWLYFDKNAHGLISSDKIKLFLRMLKLQEFYTYVTHENGIKERQKCNLLVDSILLREMAEELRRYQKQQGVQCDGGAGGGGEGGGGNQEDKEHNFRFQDVLKMLAFRSEDITQRLVPHQLYIREELERSVQFDVAEQCILKWIQDYVKPVINKQERVRRKTVIQKPNRRDDSIYWPPLNKDSEDDTLKEVYEYPVESDEDMEPLKESRNLGKHLSRSEEEIMEAQSLDTPRDRLHDPLLAKSYTRLESAPFFHFKQPGAGPGGKDKWHDWFEMQKDWMNNVEEDPVNYFDDNL